MKKKKDVPYFGRLSYFSAERGPKAMETWIWGPIKPPGIEQHISPVNCFKNVHFVGCTKNWVVYRICCEGYGAQQSGVDNTMLLVNRLGVARAVL